VALAFEEVTNNTFAYNWSVPVGEPGKLSVLSTATHLTSRIDLNRDPELDTGTFAPSLSFATNDVIENRLAFDSGPGELVSLNYRTGRWVVLAHTRDISRRTNLGLVQLIWVEAISDNELRIVDFASSTILAARLRYLSIPVNFRS
jgi:hypothetical protein